MNPGAQIACIGLDGADSNGLSMKGRFTLRFSTRPGRTYRLTTWENDGSQTLAVVDVQEGQPIPLSIEKVSLCSRANKIIVNRQYE